MPIVFDGSAGTVTGISTGGLPDGCVDTDTLANNAVTAAKSTGLSGVAVVDEWRTTNTQDINTTGDLTAHWERNDNYFSQIGTGLTNVGSGVYQFGETGIYLVTFTGSIYKTSGDNRFIGLRIYYSADSGSNYNMMAISYGSIKYISGETFDQINARAVIDVTNASTSRLKFNSTSSVIHTWTGGQEWAGTGNANTNTTGFNVIKLGDT